MTRVAILIYSKYFLRYLRLWFISTKGIKVANNDRSDVGGTFA